MNMVLHKNLNSGPESVFTCTKATPLKWWKCSCLSDEIISNESAHDA